MLADWLIPPHVSMVLALMATIGLAVMYRIGHNRSVIGLMLANLWISCIYGLDAFGVIDATTRTVALRAGVSLLEFAIIVGAAVFMLKHWRRR